MQNNDPEQIRGKNRGADKAEKGKEGRRNEERRVSILRAGNTRLEMKEREC